MRGKSHLLVAVALGVLAAGCEDPPPEAAPSDGPRAPTEPIPTTPPHRRPLAAGDIKRLEAVVAKQVTAQKPELDKACWDDTAEVGKGADGRLDKNKLKEIASGGDIELRFELLFGEDGQELSRRVAEHPSKKRPGLAACLDEKMPPLKIPAQNRKVQISVPIKFP